MTQKRPLVRFGLFPHFPTPSREKRIHDSRVVLVNPDMDEHMAPSMVSYFQRRLGMKTPFPAEPEQPSNVVEYVPAPGMMIRRCPNSPPRVSPIEPTEPDRLAHTDRLGILHHPPGAGATPPAIISGGRRCAVGVS